MAKTEQPATTCAGKRKAPREGRERVLPSYQGPVPPPLVLSDAAGMVQWAGFLLQARAARCEGRSHPTRKAHSLTRNQLGWGCLVSTRCHITLCAGTKSWMPRMEPPTCMGY